MQVTRTMCYAVHAVLLLERAAPGQPLSCSEMAAKGDMPERFLLQILRSLVNHGVLESIRGVEGGYVLARKPRRITMLDLFEALGEPLVSEIVPMEDVPAGTRRAFQRALKRVTNAARRELSRISLADLSSGEKLRSGMRISRR